MVLHINIKIVASQFSFLTFWWRERCKGEESDTLAEMKVAAAMAQAEAMKGSENEALKKLETTQKEIEDMKAATEEALKRCIGGMSKNKQKAAEATSRILVETEMSSESSPTHNRIQKQNQPTKIIEARKLENEKTFVSKKVILPNISSIFHRKKNRIEGASPP